MACCPLYKASRSATRRHVRPLHGRARNRFRRRQWMETAVSFARLPARIAPIRADFMHKLTTRLCRENQAVVIEDLHVKGMPANERLARSISDVGFGMFRSQIEYKACVPASRQVRQRVRPPRAGATAVQAASLRISAPGHKPPFKGISGRTFGRRLRFRYPPSDRQSRTRGACAVCAAPLFKVNAR